MGGFQPCFHLIKGIKYDQQKTLLAYAVLLPDPVGRVGSHQSLQDTSQYSSAGQDGAVLPVLKCPHDGIMRYHYE